MSSVARPASWGGWGQGNGMARMALLRVDLRVAGNFPCARLTRPQPSGRVLLLHQLLIVGSVCLSFQEAVFSKHLCYAGRPDGVVWPEGMPPTLGCFPVGIGRG